MKILTMAALAAALMLAGCGERPIDLGTPTTATIRVPHTTVTPPPPTTTPPPRRWGCRPASRRASATGGTAVHLPDGTVTAIGEEASFPCWPGDLLPGGLMRIGLDGVGEAYVSLAGPRPRVSRLIAVDELPGGSGPCYLPFRWDRAPLPLFGTPDLIDPIGFVVQDETLDCVLHGPVVQVTSGTFSGFTAARGAGGSPTIWGLLPIPPAA